MAIRGRASDQITNDLAYRLGRAVASVFTADVFVGYDTRESSPLLASRRAGRSFATGGAARRQTRLLHDARCRGSSPNSAAAVGVVVSALAQIRTTTTV